MDDLRKSLFRALEKSDINMLRVLLAQGVSLAYEAGDPDPVCFVACYQRPWLDALQFLQANGADLSAREPQYQDSLLNWCMNNLDDDLLPWLITQGLDVNAANSVGRTPIFFAASSLEPKTDPDTRARAMRDVKCLVAAGADIQVLGDGHTLLHNAAFRGASDLVAYLLSQGADVQAVNAQNETPLHTIALRDTSDIVPDHLAVLDLLLAAGADIDALDQDGHSPLACTYVGANIAVARRLIKHGADVNANKGTPLRMMLTDDTNELLDLLVAAATDLNTVQGDERLSPFGLAAHNNCLHGLAVLLDQGVDIEVENVDGETALLIASWRGYHAAVELLLKRGANRLHTDHYGNTPSTWAERRKDARLIEMLTS